MAIGVQRPALEMASTPVLERLSGKRLMILGAGLFQTAAIRKAAELGCYVITVDYIPSNLGHSYGHQYLNCSVTDKESVLRAATDLNIEGICTFSSDVAVPTVAYVSEQLGLPGTSSSVAETMTTKHLFRKFLKDARISCPAFISGDVFASIATEIHHLRPPILFKPVDTSGSRGLTRIDQIGLQSCEAAFLKAQDFARSRTVCVEEFVPGIEVGGDAIVVDGRVVFIAITHKHLNGFVVTGHSLPTNISTHDQARVINHIETICKAMRFDTGPLNFDVIVSENSVTMLEMSPRNGGNGISAVIERATGVDVEQAAILLSLGENPIFPDSSEVNKFVGSFVFGSPKKGILQNFTPADTLMREIPEISDVFYVKKHGDYIESFEHNGNFIGLVLFTTNSATDYDRLCRRIIGALKLVIEPN